MTWRDILAISTGNLWRLKLRAALTIVGVMIGVGALVAMLSFGVGMQRNITREFQQLGLFQTLHVLPRPADKDHSKAGPPIGANALAAVAKIPGVTLVYPQVSFDVSAQIGSQTKTATVQGLPAAFTRERFVGIELAGRLFADDKASEAVVDRSWLAELGMTAEQAIGQTIAIDAAGKSDIIASLASRELARLGLSESAAEVTKKAGQPLLDLLWPSSRSVTIVGVGDTRRFGFRSGTVLLPIDTATAIDHLSFRNPVELLTLMSGSSGEGWPLLVATLESQRRSDEVRAAIEKLDYKVFSFIDQFEEAKRVFLFFDVLMAAIGATALTIAGLGIVNTMVMSIIERRREIGLLKSLGAEDADVRRLFLAESGLIGGAGAIGGVALGWIVSRVIAFAGMTWMRSQNMPALDPFAMPVAVVAVALLFGIGAAVLAGLYPAARAARVDPVQALRGE